MAEGNCSNGFCFVGDFVGTFNGLATGRILSRFIYVEYYQSYKADGNRLA
jgi:hypothetical protein